jgi:integrase
MEPATATQLDRPRGKLIVVGSGIHQAQLTLAALFAIRNGDRLLYMGNKWVTTLNPVAEDLDAFRAEGKHRGRSPLTREDRAGRDRVLEDWELRSIWSACERQGHPHGTLVKFLLLTGLRRNEAAQLRRSELVGRTV